MAYETNMKLRVQIEEEIDEQEKMTMLSSGESENQLNNERHWNEREKMRIMNDRSNSISLVSESKLDGHDVSYSITSRCVVDVLLWTSFITCFVTIFLTFVVLVKSSQYEKPAVRKQIVLSHPVCLQCIKLYQNHFNTSETDHQVDKLIKRVDEGILMCCAENDEQLSALLEASLRKQENRPIPVFKNVDSSLKFLPASAHKQLLPHSELELQLTEPLMSNGSSHLFVRFKKDFEDPHTEHVREITMLDDAFRIQHTGIYYVYLNVHMMQNVRNPATSSHSRKWSQYVYRKRPNSPWHHRILLETSQTPCQTRSQHQETAFVGGVFELIKDDLIQVCLSGLKMVQYKKETSYLGLIMLSSGPMKDDMQLLK